MESTSETSKPTSSSETRNQSAENWLEEAVQEYLAQIDKFYTPYWNARTELAKSVISLASASIVLTVTFSGSLINIGKRDTWNYLLFGSWLLFLLSIISGVLCLWFSTRLKASPIHFIMFDKKLRSITLEAFRDKDSKKDWFVPIIATVENTISKAFYPDIWAQLLLAMNLLAFILALVMLGLFGWRQFAV
jgi:hypothetical protein